MNASSMPFTHVCTQILDDGTATPHGGQDWRSCTDFEHDFSVTTNGMGPPESALKKAYNVDISHYPPANFEPHVSHLADFLWCGNGAEHCNTLLLGNGASELIDLVIRSFSDSSAANLKWRPGDSIAQYQEYERCATECGYLKASEDDKTADLLCMVNPNNPSGRYRSLEEMKQYIEGTCKDNSVVVVDESMQPWLGKHWRDDSLSSQVQWRHTLATTKGIKVFVIHSWTKLFACTALRIGSIIAPLPTDVVRMKRKQIPWSVNSIALAFISEAISDHKFLEQTWLLTKHWRRHLVKLLQENFPKWSLFGEDFLPWIWIDTMCENEAAQVYEVSKGIGMPIRHAKYGYKMPTFIRIAVRDFYLSDKLVMQLSTALK